MKSPHKVILSFLICILSSVALTSCSKNLTRAEAQSQLEASYKTTVHYERIETGFYFPMGGVRPYTVPSGHLRTSLPKEVTALSEAGLLNVTVTASGLTENYGDFTGDHVVDHIAITPTEKGKPFFAGTSDGYINLVGATPTIEILGITEPAEGFGKKMCSVRFQVSWKNTQVADIFKRRYSVDKKEATFVKYDNGWRLEMDVP